MFLPNCIISQFDVRVITLNQVTEPAGYEASGGNSVIPVDIWVKTFAFVSILDAIIEWSYWCPGEKNLMLSDDPDGLQNCISANVFHLFCSAHGHEAAWNQGPLNTGQYYEWKTREGSETRRVNEESFPVSVSHVCLTPVCILYVKGKVMWHRMIENPNQMCSCKYDCVCTDSLHGNFSTGSHMCQELNLILVFTDCLQCVAAVWKSSTEGLATSVF